jgi:hypothetical protein
MVRTGLRGRGAGGVELEGPNGVLAAAGGLLAERAEGGSALAAALEIGGAVEEVLLVGRLGLGEAVDRVLEQELEQAVVVGIDRALDGLRQRVLLVDPR